MEKLQDRQQVTFILQEPIVMETTLAVMVLLRNNWYDISVSGIKRLGDAVPHTGNWPGTTDDEFDNYITLRLISSWAKRTQKR